MERPGENEEEAPLERPAADPAPGRALPPLRLPPGSDTDQKAPPHEAPTGPAGLPPLNRQQQPQAPPPVEESPTAPARGEPAAKPSSGLRVAVWILVPLVILAAIVAAVLSAAGSSAQQGTFLSIGFGPPGTVSLYRTQRVMRGYVQVTSRSQSPFELNMTEMDTLHVDTAAGANTQITLGTNDWGLFNGQNLTPVVIPTSVVVQADGRVTSGGKIPLATTQGHVGGMPGTDLFLPLFPNRPVVRGDTWNVDYRRPFAIPDSGSLEYRTTNRLVRFESVSGARAAVVSTSARVPVDVSVDMGKLRRIAPALVDQIINSLNLTPESRFAYRGVITYQMTSTLDTRSHNLLSSKVDGNVDVRITATGVASPGSFTIQSGLTQVTRRVS